MNKKKFDSVVTVGVPKPRIPVMNYDEAVSTFLKGWCAALIPKSYLHLHIEKIETLGNDMLTYEYYKNYLNLLRYIRSEGIEPPKELTEEYIKKLKDNFSIQRGLDAIKNLREKAAKRNNKPKSEFKMQEGSKAKWTKINETLHNSWGTGRLFESQVIWKQEGGKLTLLLFIQALELYLVHNVGNRWDYKFAAENFVLKNGDKTRKINVKEMYDVPKQIRNAKPNGVVDKRIRSFQKELHQLITSLRNVS